MWLVKRGIRTIVTVREIPLPVQWLSLDETKDPHSGNKIIEKINYLHLRVEDYHSPSIEQIDSTVNFIKNEIDAKRPVLVHCAAGKGRTGTILGAYLLRKESLSAKNAITRIRNLRPGSIQTDSQEKSLHEYEKYLKDNSVNG
jgi:atypical dual specificity phosphatase